MKYTRSQLSLAWLALVALLLSGPAMAATTATTGSTGSSSPINTTKPALTMTWMICTNGVIPTAGANTDSAFMGEMRLFATDSTYITNNSNFWLACNGQSLPVSQNAGLFSMLGYTFGGSGNNFNIPDMRGRVPVGAGQGPGMTNRLVGDKGGGDGGSAGVTLTAANLPAHTHTITGGNTGATGSGTGVSNMPPFVVLRPWMVSGGVYNSMGTIRWSAQATTNNIPGLACDGAVLNANTNVPLFGKLGATYGGNGSSTFGVPDLRGRMAIAAGNGTGLTARTLGQSGGAESYTLTTSDMPAHTHTYPGGTTGSAGGAGASHALMAPFLALTPGIATYGPFAYGQVGPWSTPAVGEVRFFAQSATQMINDGVGTSGWEVCDGGQITGATSQTVNHGASGTQVTAVANANYHFTGWSDGVLTAARTDSNVTSNVSVTANFAINTYTLSYSAGPNGSITGATPQTVNHGANGTQVTAVANANYQFTGWSDGVLTAARTDSNVTANLSVAANFAISAPTGLTYSSDPATYTKGTAIANNTPSSGGGPVSSYSVSPALPAGLVLNTGTGVISGTPTVIAATAGYTVTATNAGGSATKSVSITVNDVRRAAAIGGLRENFGRNVQEQIAIEVAFLDAFSQ